MLMNHQRRWPAVLLDALLMLSLTACGGGEAEVTDPNVGVWNAVGAETQGMEIPVEVIAPEGFWLELMDGGEAELHSGDSYAESQWTLEDGALTIWDETMTSTGKISSDGILTLENVLDSGVTMFFEKEGGYSAAVPAEGKPESLAPTEIQQMWNGAWFGCIDTLEATDIFESMPIGTSDMFMVVEVDADNHAVFELYLPGNEDPFMNGEGTASLQGLVADEAWLIEEIPLNASNWTFLPMPNYPDQFALGDRYDDADYGIFDFMLFMKPWGHSWEEEVADNAMYPPSVEGYHESIAAGGLPMYGEPPADYHAVG